MGLLAKIKWTSIQVSRSGDNFFDIFSERCIWIDHHSIDGKVEDQHLSAVAGWLFWESCDSVIGGGGIDMWHVTRQLQSVTRFLAPATN